MYVKMLLLFRHGTIHCAGRLKKIVTDTVREGFVDGVRILVNENGVGCLVCDGLENGFHVACKYGQVELVKFLLGLIDCEKVVTAINFKKARWAFNCNRK